MASARARALDEREKPLGGSSSVGALVAGADAAAAASAAAAAAAAAAHSYGGELSEPARPKDGDSMGRPFALALARSLSYAPLAPSLVR